MAFWKSHSAQPQEPSAEAREVGELRRNNSRLVENNVAQAREIQVLRAQIRIPENRPHDLKALQARVGLLAQDDPLWGMLRGLLRKNLETETEAVARAAIGDEEVHRARGRVGMLLDLEAQFCQVWVDSHRE